MASDMNEQPRSIRRAALIGDRREVLVTEEDRRFTIKDARDLLRYSEHVDLHEEERRRFYLPESYMTFFIWRKYFSNLVYRGGHHLLHPEWVTKHSTDDLVAAQKRFGPLRDFVRKCRVALIERGLLEAVPQRGRNPSNSLYWLTDDGVLLETAAWYVSLSPDKAEALIKGLLERAVYVTRHPHEFLVMPTMIGIFGSYTDERVTAYNDLDVLLEHDRVGQSGTDEKSWEAWRKKAEALYKKDGRNNNSGRWGDDMDWPATKLKRYLRARKPQLRIITGTVSQPIRVKVLYHYGILDHPVFVDLPNGNGIMVRNDWHRLMEESINART